MRRSVVVLCGVALSLTIPIATVAAQQKPEQCSLEKVSVHPTNKEANEDSTVEFSVNNDQDVTSYDWKQSSSDVFQVSVSVDAAGGNKGDMSFTAPGVGPSGATLHFELTVTGCGGATKTVKGITATIVNVNTNAAPRAEFTVSPESIFEGMAVTLDASRSSDTDGDTLTYTWSAPGLTLTSIDGVTTGFTAPQVPFPDGATYQVELTVSDGTLTNKVSQSVTVKWFNEPPVVGLSCPAQVNEGAPVTLNGSASRDDEDGIASYSWSQTFGGPTATLPIYDSTTASSLTFQAPALTDKTNHTMRFELRVTDKGALSESKTCDVLVLDITPPAISCGQPDGQWYGSDVAIGCTAVDVGSELSSAADAAFELATNVASGTETADAWTGKRDVCDSAGNCATAGPIAGNKVDKKGPEVSCDVADTAWHNTNQSVTCSVSDDGSGPVTALVTLSTDVAENSETSAAWTNSATANDNVGNSTAVASVGPFKIDRKAPVNVLFVGGPSSDATYYFNFVPPAPTCTASDAGSGLGDCKVSGYSLATGTHILIATATDTVGNTSTAIRTYTVAAWTLKGFYQPVDMSAAIPVYNTVKGGSTVPFKFEVFAGSRELTDVAMVKSFTHAPMTCDANSFSDDIETLATGGTVLRYDAVAGQFVYNWKTPTGAGTCYRVTMTTQDGSSLVAYFKLK